MLANSYNPSNQAATNPWIGGFRQSDTAKLTVFCFPYAGGTSLAFRTWAAVVPRLIDVCPINLPGRSSRLDEPPFRSIQPLVEAVGEALKPLHNRPFVFFGHSMGALISFELARHYRKQNVMQPVQIFASGHRAPHVPDPDPPTYNISDDEFIEELRRLNGTPGDVLENAELLELMLPLLRADFELCQTYNYEDEPPLSCPVTAFGGIDDVDIPRTSIEEWQKQTTGRFVMRMVKGDHFFLHTQERLIVETVARDLYRIATSDILPVK